MKPEMEKLLAHWGEQLRCKGLGGSGASPLAGLIEWQGAPPRGEAGSVMLVGGAGMDHAASEVEAVLVDMKRRGAAEDRRTTDGARSLSTQLVGLAKDRYLRQLSVEMQRAGLGDCSESTYLRRLAELHRQVALLLQARHDAALKDIARIRKAGVNERKGAQARRVKSESRLTAQEA